MSLSRTLERGLRRQGSLLQPEWGDVEEGVDAMLRDSLFRLDLKDDLTAAIWGMDLDQPSASKVAEMIVDRLLGR